MAVEARKWRGQRGLGRAQFDRQRQALSVNAEYGFGDDKKPGKLNHGPPA